MVRLGNILVLRARTVLLVFATALLGSTLIAGPAQGFSISRFSVAPSTTQAGGHPNLSVSFSFAEPSTVRDVSLHLPAGLTANPGAIPFCARKWLVRSLCPSKSKVGSLTVTAVAFDLELPVTRSFYNISPVAHERLRLGAPLLGTYSRPGIAAELPVTERPGDKGLDMTVAGLPSEVGGYPVRLKDVSLRIRGVARIRVRKRLKERPFLTNPLSCAPATSVLAVTPQDAPAAPVTTASSFTPSGCSVPST
jgi:hypothetical protein